MRYGRPRRGTFSPACRAPRVRRISRGPWLLGLWRTAHRLNDLRRLERAVGVRGGYGRPDASVFPHGLYFKNGLTYGTDVNYPIPLDEQNNPNFQQCLDRLP